MEASPERVFSLWERAPAPSCRFFHTIDSPNMLIINPKAMCKPKFLCFLQEDEGDDQSNNSSAYGVW